MFCPWTHLYYSIVILLNCYSQHLVPYFQRGIMKETNIKERIQHIVHLDEIFIWTNILIITHLPNTLYTHWRVHTLFRHI